MVNYDSMYDRDPWKDSSVFKHSGTRKIGSLPNVCSHPGHNPPAFMVFENGVYEHVCPACGAVQHFTVANPTF